MPRPELYVVEKHRNAVPFGHWRVPPNEMSIETMNPSGGVLRADIWLTKPI
jgi:hypothetical protein